VHGNGFDLPTFQSGLSAIRTISRRLTVMPSGPIFVRNAVPSSVHSLKNAITLRSGVYCSRGIFSRTDEPTANL
jgi:hypothetical protein